MVEVVRDNAHRTADLVGHLLERVLLGHLELLRWQFRASFANEEVLVQLIRGILSRY
jgi:hypothetical protein